MASARQRRIGLALLLCLVSAVLMCPDLAAAEPPRVALVGAPANLTEATITALSSWRIEVIAVPDNGSLASLSPVQRARAVASEQGAGAVIWLADAGDGYALWLYDVEHDRLQSRPLAARPPFSEPAAASVALSIKTLLRNSGMAPRAGMDDTTASGDPAASDTSGSDPAGSDPGASDPAAGNPRLDPDGAAHAAGPDHPARVSATANAVVRIGRSGAPGTEARLGLELSWSPRVLPDWAIVAHARLGSGSEVHSGGFDGEFTDRAVGVALRRRFRLTGALWGGASLGLSLHRTRVTGVLDMTAQDVAFSRVNPAVDGSGLIALRVSGQLHVRLHVTASYTLRRQQYVAFGEPVVRIPRLGLAPGLGFGATWAW